MAAPRPAAARRRRARPTTTRRALAPIYAWLARARAARATTGDRRQRGRAPARAWTRAHRRRPPRRCARSALAARASRSAIAAAQPRRPRAAARRPVRAPSCAARGAARRWARSSSALGIDAAHVIFGHTPPRRAAGRATTPRSGARRRRPAAQHRLLGLRAALHRGDGPTARPTGRAPPCVVEDDGPPQLAARCSDGARPRAGSDQPGVKQMAWHVTPSPTSSSSTPCGVALVLDERVRARVLDGDRRRAVDRDARPRPSSTAHTAAGLVGAAVGARLVRGLRRRAAPRASSSGRSGASGSRSTPSSSWIASSVSA